MFYRLISRIPKAFKDCLKENLLDIHFDTHDTTDTFVKKIVSNKKAKFIYRSLIDKFVHQRTNVQLFHHLLYKRYIRVSVYLLILFYTKMNS
jgi:hypothetical protein